MCYFKVSEWFVLSPHPPKKKKSSTRSALASASYEGYLNVLCPQSGQCTRRHIQREDLWESGAIVPRILILCTKLICRPYVTRIPAKPNKLKCASDSVSGLWLNRFVRLTAAVTECTEPCFHCHMHLQDLRYYRYD